MNNNAAKEKLLLYRKVILSNVTALGIINELQGDKFDILRRVAKVTTALLFRCGARPEWLRSMGMKPRLMITLAGRPRVVHWVVWRSPETHTRGEQDSQTSRVRIHKRW